MVQDLKVGVKLSVNLSEANTRETTNNWFELTRGSRN